MPIINIADKQTPQPNMTAELGSLKKSISVIALTRLDHTEGTENRWYPKTHLDSIQVCIGAIQEKE